MVNPCANVKKMKIIYNPITSTSFLPFNILDLNDIADLWPYMAISITTQNISLLIDIWQSSGKYVRNQETKITIFTFEASKKLSETQCHCF